jgi:hypothetical protein
MSGQQLLQFSIVEPRTPAKDYFSFNFAGYFQMIIAVATGLGQVWR